MITKENIVAVKELVESKFPGAFQYRQENNEDGSIRELVYFVKLSKDNYIKITVEGFYPIP